MRSVRVSAWVLLGAAAAVAAAALPDEMMLDDNRLSIDERYATDADPEPEPAGEAAGVWQGLFRMRGYHATTEGDDRQQTDYCYSRMHISRSSSDTHAEAGAVGLRSSRQPACDARGMGRYFLRKYYVAAESPATFGSFIAGNYTLSFGQGLVFYDSLAAFVRPIEASVPRARPDTGTGDQNYLRGLAVSRRIGPVEVFSFVSRKELNGDEIDGSADVDLYAIRDDYNALQTAGERSRFHAFDERLIGGRIGVAHSFLRAGLTGYEARYGAVFDPRKTCSAGR